MGLCLYMQDNYIVQIILRSLFLKVFRQSKSGQEDKQIDDEIGLKHSAWGMIWIWNGISNSEEKSGF